MSMDKADAYQAIMISLAHDEVPESIGQRFRAAGFLYQDGDWAAFAHAPPERGTVHLLWVGSDWQMGFERLASVSEEQRSSAVLIGEHSQGGQGKENRGTIREILRLGGLAAIALPIPEWFLAPLGEALGRLGCSHQRQLAQVINELQQDLGKTPESLLFHTAQAAGQLLAADLAVATLKSYDSDRFEALTHNPQGQLRTEPWLTDETRRRTPQGLTRFIREKMETIVVPAAAHFRHCEPGKGSEHYEGAVIRPIRIEGPEMDRRRRPLIVCINLFWQRPYLPTPNELLDLEILAALAKSTLARLVEQKRLAEVHSKARRAFADAIGGEPLIPGVDLEMTSDLVTEALPHLARLMAEAYAGRPGLRELWIRLPYPWVGQEASQWLAFGESVAGQEPPPRVSETGKDLEMVEVLTPEGGWAVQTRWVSDKPHLGELIAIFVSRSSAWAAQSEVRRLADDLYQAARQQRKEADTTALLQLSTVPAEPQEAWEDLRAILEMIREQTGSDGARVYVILRTAAGPKFWLLCSTDFPAAAPEPLPLLHGEQGLVDWVLTYQDWLLILELSGDTGKKAEIGITGRHDIVNVFARPESDHWPEVEEADNEDTMLFVPLVPHGSTTGVLAIWRERQKQRPNTPYDENIDTEALLQFAPHVASSCQRMLQLNKAQDELAAISDLARHLTDFESLAQAYAAVARGVCHVADTAVTVLLHHDAELSGELYLSAWWCADESCRKAVAPAIQRLRIAVGTDPETWSSRVEDELRQKLGDFTFRGLLIPAATEDDSPPLVVALFDRAAEESVFFSDGLLEHFALSFLQAACAMLEEYAAGLASRLIDQIGSSKGWSKARAHDVLQDGAKLLGKATGADATLIYIGTPKQMTVRSVWPQTGLLQGLQVEPNSYTERSLLQDEPMRVLDVDAHGEGMNQQNLQRFVKALGWTAVGSWLCCAVVHDGRSIGLIKLLTCHDGGFLGKDHERMTRLIAERTAVEMYKANSREQLQNLLAVSDHLTAFRGTRLEKEMVQELRQWIRNALLRPRCQVALVAHVPGERIRLVLAGSAEVSDKVLQRLEKISISGMLEHEKGVVSALSEVPGAMILHRPTGVASPIALPGEERLSGHLFVLDAEQFNRDDMEAIGRAAHYIALVINGERERRNWRQVMGRFRHAVLGPVQGLTSAAKMLIAHFEKVDFDNDKIERLRGQIIEESRIIRLWRKNQRFYLSDNLEAQLRKQPLKPIVERCIERYLPIAKTRNIEMTFDWHPGSELHVDIDPEAIDIAISNLIENACKYSFYNRSITVGTLVDQRTIRLWVEDIGHPIPVDVGDEVYEFGKRGVSKDPLRVISGQGIGLTMVMAAVEAHGGSLGYSCDPVGHGKREETTPYKVRFTIDLPWSIA